MPDTGHVAVDTQDNILTMQGGMIMFCKQCGAEIDENDVFCSNCGYKREKNEPQPEIYYEEPVNYTVRTVVKKKSKNKVVGGVYLFVMGALDIFLSLMGENDDIPPLIALLLGLVLVAIGIYLFSKGVNGEEEQYIYRDGGPETSMFDKEPGTWTCSKCGKVNANYIGTCSCGQSRV